MPVDVDKYKQDPRSPRQLAKAILDHELIPHTKESFSLSFREQLLMDYQSPHHVESTPGLLWALKALEEDLPCDADRKRALRRALHVTDAYRREAAEWRDDDASATWEGGGGQHAEVHRREAAESMETCMVQIGNLLSINKLLRALAHKLGVSLAEPHREK